MDMHNCLNIRCDLDSDLNRCARSWLCHNGFAYKENHTLDAFQQFLNVQRRLIISKPRHVYRSKMLQCPIEHEGNLKNLLCKVKQGDNLTPHLSKLLLNAAYTDAFLADFGLHHFHLSSEIQAIGKGKGFVKRTGPILIALVSDDAFYAIDVRQHGKAGEPYLWADASLLEIVHQNWPNVLARYRIKGISKLACDLDKEKRHRLRINGINTFITMDDGTTYMSPGGGITTARTATNITIEGDRKRDFVRRLLDAVVQTIAANQAKIIRYPITLRLMRLGWPFVFVDESNGIFVAVKETQRKDQVNISLALLQARSLADFKLGL